MKNESGNLPKLFKAISELNYPPDKFEIVIVDDNSSDDSFEKAKNLSANLENIKLVKAGKKKFPAKKGALNEGLKYCKFENIALTDADCEPSPNWLISISDALENSDFAFGAAPLKSSNNFVSNLASYESGKNQTANYLALKIGVPISATGRNFAYKKSSFEKIGGYGKTLETLSGDDDLLLREAFKNKFKITFAGYENSAVYSYAPDCWKNYFRQKKRHLKTSHHYTFTQKLFSSVYFLGDILSTYSLLLIPLSWYFSVPYIIKIKIAYFNYKKFRDFFGTKLTFAKIILYETIHPTIMIVNFIYSLFPANDWKER